MHNFTVDAVDAVKNLRKYLILCVGLQIIYDYRVYISLDPQRSSLISRIQEEGVVNNISLQILQCWEKKGKTSECQLGNFQSASFLSTTFIVKSKTNFIQTLLLKKYIYIDSIKCLQFHPFKE